MRAAAKHQVIQQFIHSNGLHRIEFVRQRDGRVLVEEQQWSHKSQSWYPTPTTEPSVYDTYAESFVLTALRVTWLAEIFHEHRPDYCDRYKLELLRGLTFRPVVSEPGFWGDEYDCEACGQHLSAWEGADQPVNGYVTRWPLLLSGGDWQWRWVCTACFVKFQDKLQWTLAAPK